MAKAKNADNDPDEAKESGLDRKVKMLKFCAGSYGVLSIGETEKEIPGDLADALIAEGVAEEL